MESNLNSSPNQVQLINGTWVASDSEAWRHECEARYVTNLPTTMQRRAYLEAAERKRGTAAVEALRTTIKAMWPATGKEPK